LKKLLFTGFLTVFLISGPRLSAQNPVYTYDNAGNRISRGIITLRSSREDAPSPEPLSDFISKQEIKLYPNPTRGILMVELPGLSEPVQGEIRIINSSGQTVKHSRNIALQNTFDLGGQANGIYLLRITLNDETMTWKVIKQ
jgi:hypothetical protein